MNITIHGAVSYQYTANKTVNNLLKNNYNDLDVVHKKLKKIKDLESHNGFDVTMLLQLRSRYLGRGEVENRIAAEIEKTAKEIFNLICQKDQKDIHSIPTKFYNDRANCWFHSGLQILWALGPYLHQLILKKEQQRASLEEDYKRELANFLLAQERNETRFKRKTEEYNLQKKQYENALKTEIHNYKVKYEEYTEAVKQYEADLKKWNNSTTRAKKPALPAEPAKPQKIRPPQQPKFSVISEPVNPLELLDALTNYSHVVRNGSFDEIQIAVENLQKAFVRHDPGFQEEGTAQDASSFIGSILHYLSMPFIKVADIYEGKMGSSFEGLKCTSLSEVNLLDFTFQNDRTKQVGFQDILKENFEDKEVNNPDCSISIKDVRVTEYTRKQKIVENPPEFIFVNMKRYTMTEKGQKKITTHIEFPENLKINFASAFSVVDLENADFEYELCGSLVHIENEKFSHYIAYVKGLNSVNEESNWYYTDDANTQVEQITHNQAWKGSQDGYVYLFKKVKCLQGNSNQN